MFVIDAHNHIGNRRGRKGQSAEEIIAQMDESNIDQAVVFSYVPYPNNDYIGDMVKKYPDRLIGFAILDHTQKNPEKELERAVVELGLKGLKLDTPTHGFSIDDFSVTGPTFEVANKYHLPVICYCGDNNFVHPYKFAEAAKRYPNINFIMAHAGILFMTSHAIEVCMENKNCYIEISNINGKVINDAKDKGVLSQVLFGTDTPFNYFEVMKCCVESALDDDSEKELVYSKNFKNILNQVKT
ncbi:amidohydrolase family protein [Breznakia pachnodae]|uniref:TIM-barrel fold metal-dependent hydrolase n=1 Tax=Breznakia pachnodae TaxID=265178 RepID=A0ABU0E4J2_9FIRM|nr:amidohydrolase family protein [Breznakia pachnodae]MDQ0361809.1 putative TIM-barrel fold metal-dependent hydrolase [Breznakia pachnodae]